MKTGRWIFSAIGWPARQAIAKRTLRAAIWHVENRVPEPVLVESIDGLSDDIQQWSLIYNTIRPHSSLGYKTSNELELQKEKFYFRAVAA